MPVKRDFNFSIGADPECFIVNTKTNKVKSAIKLIPGTKDNPHLVPELGPGFALQTDNILAEFNIPPVTNAHDFVANITAMKDYIRSLIKEANSNYDILCTASQTVPKSELRSKQAKEFGCDRDYCIYTGAPNPKPAAADTVNLRSAGFHIHIGYDRPNIDTSLIILAYLDAYLGLPSIIMDTDTDRRKLYGKAGCFRLTSYGCEYRSLSSFFMKDEEHLRWVFSQVLKALTAYSNGMELPSAAVVQRTINNNDVETARSLCRNYNICSNFLNN